MLFPARWQAKKCGLESCELFDLTQSNIDVRIAQEKPHRKGLGALSLILFAVDQSTPHAA